MVVTTLNSLRQSVIEPQAAQCLGNDQVRGCPLCGQVNTRSAPSRYSRPPWLIKHCGGCEFTYLENPPGYAALEQEFAWERTKAVEAALRYQQEPWLHQASAALWAFTPRRAMRPKAVRLVQQFVPGGPLLDVGCGKGRLGVQIGPAYLPFGIEISRELAAGADRHFRERGGRVINRDALAGLESFDENFFAGVVMKSYLEHEAAPREVLTAACRAMRPGAALIVKVPNFASWNRRVRQRRWCGFRYPDHVNYFTPRSIVALLESTGFAIERFKLRDCWPLSDNQWVVARKC